MKKANLGRGEFNIYVLKNDANNIKIGITKNFSKRLVSLSGSNGGGNKIIEYFVSPKTYLYFIETSLHNKFGAYRISGTEWFKGISFEEVVTELQKIFCSEQYIESNERFKKFSEEKEKQKLSKEEIEKIKYQNLYNKTLNIHEEDMLEELESR